eukprot:TRINITY_DN73507_c0_g1_i1.p1 TRINITY_DN73507_c0_g1~~TRINITY_DN73507_c0_g1_i1.p1  ORF type:complete len:451 (-),score=107.46 TRINITY_DN73507_c0_g1_i1:125-1477(-)
MPRSRAKDEEESAAIRRIFVAYDLNGDGKIDRDEFASVLRKLDSKSWTDRKVLTLLNSIDTDHDGKIDADELVRWALGVSKRASKDLDAVKRAANIAAKAKPVAKASAAAPADETKAEAAEDEEGKAELHRVLKDLFTLYDTDGDGQIERVELLDGEEMRLGVLNFGTKERKECIKWFKEAGAEGTPVAGMYLSEEKWVAATIKTAEQDSGINQSEPRKLAEWIWGNKAKTLAEFAKIEEAKKSAAAKPADASGNNETVAKGKAPDYPVTCKLAELNDRINEAANFKRPVLILASGLQEVETFLSYTANSLLDCKMLIGKMYVAKEMSLAEAQAHAKSKLTLAMNSHGFCKPLFVRLNNSAFDFNKLCGDDFPADVFSADAWTIENAYQRGFFDKSQKMNLEIDDEKKWKDFQVVIASTFNLDDANKYLADKIPHYESIAKIIVDPTSVA